jgi:hypothetical protein
MRFSNIGPFLQGKTVGLFTGLLIVHGLLNSLATKQLAYITRSFVFVNLGTTIGELPSTPRKKARSRQSWHFRCAR